MTWCMADNTPIDADLPDAVRSWNEEFAFPHLKICTATEMMQAFEKYGDRLPTLQGDYTEYWTDGLGSSAAKTGESREVKDRLVQAQILWSMLHPGKEEPTELIQEAWRHIILSTEHTWAYMAPDQQPLSDEILAAKLGYFDKARELTSQVMDKTLAPIEDRTSDIVSVFNTNTWAQSGIVTLPRETVGDYRSIQDAEGREVPCRMLTTGEMAFMAEQVPALGHKTFRLRSEEARTAGIPDGPANVLDNGMVRLVLNPVTGDVASLTYRGEEFVDQEALTAINSFRYPEGGNASSAAVKDTDIEITVGERGPLINSLIVRSKARGCNSLTREVRLIKGSAGVELYNVVDKQAIVAKEGIHFGFAFNVPQGQVRVNIPWGVMELEKDQLKAGNRNWIALQRWLDVSNADKGVTWCSMNACTFESGDITANIIGGANGSPKWIRQLQPSSTIYSWALNNHWHTNFRLSQDGLIGYKYRLLPHVGAYDVVRSHRYAMEQYRPLVAVQIGKGFHTAGSLSLTGSDMVALSNYRTVDRGRTNVVRLLSMSDKAEHVSLQWSGKQPRAISYTEDGKVVKRAREGHSIEVPAKGILTLNIAW